MSHFIRLAAIATVALTASTASAQTYDRTVLEVRNNIATQLHNRYRVHPLYMAQPMEVISGTDAMGAINESALDDEAKNYLLSLAQQPDAIAFAVNTASQTCNTSDIRSLIYVPVPLDDGAKPPTLELTTGILFELADVASPFKECTPRCVDVGQQPDAPGCTCGRKCFYDCTGGAIAGGCTACNDGSLGWFDPTQEQEWVQWHIENDGAIDPMPIDMLEEGMALPLAGDIQ